ncbi:MAG TPA: ester cyclase [Chitinophagaceae bacterium]
MKLLFAAVLFLLINACNMHEEKNSSVQPSVQEKNKELIRTGFDNVVNKQNYSLIDSLFADSIYDHGAFEGQEQGFAGFKKAVIDFLSTFSHIEATIEEIIAERDIVATREHWTVTRKSDNKVLSGVVMHWFRIDNGKVTDEWSKGWEWMELGSSGQ